MRPRWPGHCFCQFEKRLPQPEIKSTRRIYQEIRCNPTWCFIILGDPGADKGGEGKSKRAEKYIWNEEK